MAEEKPKPNKQLLHQSSVVAAGLFVYAGGYGCRQARTDRISDTVGGVGSRQVLPETSSS